MKLGEKIGLYWDLFWKGRPALETAIEQGKLAASAAKTAGVRTLGFWSVALGGVGAVAAQTAGLVPPPWGAIVMAGSGLLYALSRGLVKRDDPLGGAKPVLATSEGVLNLLGAGAQLLGAVQGVVSPQTAAILVAVQTASVAIGQALAQSGAQPPAK